MMAAVGRVCRVQQGGVPQCDTAIWKTFANFETPFQTRKSVTVHFGICSPRELSIQSGSRTAALLELKLRLL